MTEIENKNNETEELADPERIVVFEEGLEAVLFAAGHPVSYATLARVFNMTPTEIKRTVSDYSMKYNNSEMPRGVLLLTYTDSCQLCTKEQYGEEIKTALGIRRGGNLSQSLLEVLAIIAYNQPATRTFVDTVRGVDSGYAVNMLTEKKLIEPCGRLETPGRPTLYRTTEDFLRVFGISSLEELPSVLLKSDTGETVEITAPDIPEPESPAPADTTEQ